MPVSVLIAIAIAHVVATAIALVLSFAWLMDGRPLKAMAFGGAALALCGLEGWLIYTGLAAMFIGFGG